MPAGADRCHPFPQSPTHGQTSPSRATGSSLRNLVLPRRAQPRWKPRAPGGMATACFPLRWRGLGNVPQSHASPQEEDSWGPAVPSLQLAFGKSDCRWSPPRTGEPPAPMEGGGLSLPGCTPGLHAEAGGGAGHGSSVTAPRPCRPGHPEDRAALACPPAPPALCSACPGFSTLRSTGPESVPPVPPGSPRSLLTPALGRAKETGVTQAGGRPQAPGPPGATPPCHRPLGPPGETPLSRECQKRPQNPLLTFSLKRLKSKEEGSGYPKFLHFGDKTGQDQACLLYAPAFLKK